MSKNRRSAYRYMVTLSARLSVRGKVHDTSIENLSLGGVQLAFEQRLTMGEKVQILFRVPTDPKSTQTTDIEVGATVRWNGDNSVGLQFEGLRARDVWALNKFFETATPEEEPEGS